ncbi:MAG: HAD-IA family hydrolase, partial [Anaerolineae bacterium]|nr:HAD-IA family hydrolase [Anaerolineae bacterium]
EQAIPTAIASSSPKAIIDAILKAQGWDTLFSVRCSAEDEARGKPAPDVYLRAAERLGINPGDCLALEDSPNGARAAVAAGMTCYAVPDTKHISSHAFDGITPHVFRSLHEVLDSIKANGR